MRAEDENVEKGRMMIASIELGNQTGARRRPAGRAQGNLRLPQDVTVSVSRDRASEPANRTCDCHLVSGKRIQLQGRLGVGQNCALALTIREDFP